MEEKTTIYEFGDFRLNIVEKRLSRLNGELIPLAPKLFDLLTFLVENDNRLLTKEELLDKVWADSFVEEGNLKLNIHALRKLLPESIIETVPRRGYRFTGEVRKLPSHEQTATGLNAAPARLAKRQNFRVLVAAALLFGLVFFGFYQFWKAEKPAGITKPGPLFKPNKTIAVLPFKNLTKDKQDEFLGIGLADALITRLGSVSRISVRPTSAVLPFNETISPQTISEKLQVENILEGTIQRLGKRLKISVQFVQMPGNQVLWAESFEESEGDLLKIQESISARIVKTLEVNLNQEEQNNFARSSTASEEAYRLYLKGRFHWNKRTREDLGRSLDLLESAVKLDPDFALAHAAMAEAFQLYGEYGGMNPAEAFEKSRERAQKALKINPDLAEAHNSLAYTLAFYDWDWTAAEREFLRAIELNPNYPTARQWYSEYLLVFGRFDESLSQIHQAQQLDPTSLIISSDYSGHLYLAKRYDECIEQAEKTLRQEEKFAYAYAFQWLCYEGKNDLARAFETLQKGDAIMFPKEIVVEQQRAYERGGWPEVWKYKDEFFEKFPPNQFVNNFTRAFTAMRAGKTEKAFEWLEKSYRARERWFVNLKFDPQWNALRFDPRFAELVRKANLNP